MFLILLFSSLAVSVLVAVFVARLFRSSVSGILGRIIPEEIGAAWVRYVLFAMHIAGISNGVRIWELERYINPSVAAKDPGAVPITLNTDRIVLELYRTLIGTLQGVSGVLLTFFFIALLAYVVIRFVESRRDRPA